MSQVSKFATLPFNCYELGHTWSPHCTAASSLVGYHCFVESLKIYAVGYLISRVVAKRFPKTPNDLFRFIKDVVRSSVFLSINGFGYVTGFCWLRKIFGAVNFYSVCFIPSLFACYAAILVEKPIRRPLLALYVANVAVDTLYRMLRFRGIVRDVKHFDLVLFGISASTILFQMQKFQPRNDIIGSIFMKIMGPHEFIKASKGGSSSASSTSQATTSSVTVQSMDPPKSNVLDSKPKSAKNLISKCSLKNIENLMHRVKASIYSGQGHAICPHKKTSCISYWVEGFTTRFVAGFGIQTLIEILIQFQNLRHSKSKLVSTKHEIFRILKNMVKTCSKSGLGLSLMCSMFRFLNCCFRRLGGSLSPNVGPITSALVSTCLGYHILNINSTLALYLFFKAAETVISKSHKSNNWRIIKWLDSVYGGGWCLLYFVSTAFLFHTAVVEPHNLKPSYTKYLARVTGGKLSEINRHLLSVYGTKSNLSFMDFWPQLDPKYLSEHMKKMIRMREEAGEGNKFIKDIAMQFVSH